MKILKSILCLFKKNNIQKNLISIKVLKKIIFVIIKIILIFLIIQIFSKINYVIMKIQKRRI